MKRSSGGHVQQVAILLTGAEKTKRPADSNAATLRGPQQEECYQGRTRQRPPVSRLLLRNNRLTDVGAVALSTMVVNCPGLSTIDLRGNFIGTRGATALRKVSALELGCCSI